MDASEREYQRLLAWEDRWRRVAVAYHAKAPLWRLVLLTFVAIARR